MATDVRASATVIESKVDRRLGVIATVLIQKGTMRIGDIVLAGPAWGRVRRILSDQGTDLQEAGPSTPIQVRQCSKHKAAASRLKHVDQMVVNIRLSGLAEFLMLVTRWLLPKTRKTQNTSRRLDNELRVRRSAALLAL